MIGRIITEGLLLGALLAAFCAAGIRKGAVNMVLLYHADVQERCIQNGLVTRERIDRNRRVFKSLGIPVYLAFVLVSVYAVNGARDFRSGFLQCFAILSIANLIDRIGIDEWWVARTKAWIIPGTEDLRPYIDRRDKLGKWLTGTAGFAALSAILSGIMALIL